ncbi:MAG: sulfoxide reductase heme-binding subunit YedZ [Gammaproteobacteria bacterium]|nr:sulfoxide reductase heme-binding subunit YedZ [Gammaproteobacteria bacterium]MBT6585588.1 sulfoxide reductase heme-binding subunit YedZ [Gammaproteobacteria bacterium]MBT6891455.1 sulfoxide reductase heme-binding subunit YedZ [Gammaproteobacteria bacterium]
MFKLPLFKPVTFLLCLLPLEYSIYQIYQLQTGGDNVLGADPAKELVLLQGEWAIRFLLLTLLVTPLRRLAGWRQALKVRRMLGLFTFFYASIHLLAYLLLLLELDFRNLGADILKRPYITVGFTAYLLLVPLALTSNSFAIRLLRNRWAVLHRLVYGVAILVVVHVTWLAKSSYSEAVAYGVIVTILLLVRVFKDEFALFQEALRRRV